MPATVTLCQRTGNAPGNITENIRSIAWKAVDDTTTQFDSYAATIGLGSNSYQVYTYLKLTGVFTTIGNIKVTRVSGTLPDGVKLMTNPSIDLNESRPTYTTPTRTATATTLNDLSALNSYIKLLVGNAPNGVDGAAYTGKGSVADNLGSPVYSTYFISQLQVSPTASTGDLNNFALQITYDEL